MDPNPTDAILHEDQEIKGHQQNQDNDEHVQPHAAALEHEAKIAPSPQQQQGAVESQVQDQQPHAQLSSRIDRDDDAVQPHHQPPPSRQRKKSQRRKAQFVFCHEDEDKDKDDEQTGIGASINQPLSSGTENADDSSRPVQHNSKSSLATASGTSTESSSQQHTIHPTAAATATETSLPIDAATAADQDLSRQAVDNDLSRHLEQTTLHPTGTESETSPSITSDPSAVETSTSAQTPSAATSSTSEHPISKPRPASMHERTSQRDYQEEKQQKDPAQPQQQEKQPQQQHLTAPPSSNTGAKQAGSERGVPLSKSKSNPADTRSKSKLNNEQPARTSPKSRRMTQLLDPSSSTTSLPSLTKVTTHTVMALTPGNSSAAPTLTPSITEHHSTGSNASSPVTQPSPAVELVSKFLVPNQQQQQQQQGHSSQQHHTNSSAYAGAEEDHGKGTGSPHHHVGSNGRKTVRESPGKHSTATSPQQRGSAGYTSKFYPASPSQPLSSSAPKATTTSFPSNTTASEEHSTTENAAPQGGAGSHATSSAATATSGGSAIAAAAVAQSNLAGGAHASNLSRTQQKLWLQRENVQDVDEDEMARRGKVLKEMERINREYRCVRMTMNPAVESIQRCLNRGAKVQLLFQSTATATANDLKSPQQPQRSSSAGHAQMQQLGQSPHLQTQSQPSSPSLGATGVKSQQHYQQQQQAFQRHPSQMGQYQTGGGGHHQRSGSHQNGQHHYAQQQHNVGLGLQQQQQQQQQQPGFGHHDGGQVPQSGKMTLRQMQQLQQHHHQQQLYQRQQQQQQQQQQPLQRAHRG